MPDGALRGVPAEGVGGNNVVIGDEGETSPSKIAKNPFDKE